MELTIPAMIASAAGKYGDGPALAEPGGPRISYYQLLQQTTTVARALIAEGVAHGDRVAIWSPNTHHCILAAFGALSAGTTLVPVSTRFTGPEALDVITRSGASVLIVADRFLGTDRFAALRTAAATEAAHAGAGAESYTAERRPVAGQLPGQLRLVVRVPMPDATESAPSGDAEDGVIGWAELLDRAAAVPASAAEKRAAAVHPGDVSDILFTSGTTGRSKGAMTAHRQSLAVASAWAECGGLTSTDRYLVVNHRHHLGARRAPLFQARARHRPVVRPAGGTRRQGRRGPHRRLAAQLRQHSSAWASAWPGLPAATVGGVHQVDRSDHATAAGLNNTVLQVGGGLGLAAVATAVTAGCTAAPPRPCRPPRRCTR